MASHLGACLKMRVIVIAMVVGLMYKSAEGLSLRNRSNLNMTLFKGERSDGGWSRSPRARGGGPHTLKNGGGGGFQGECGKVMGSFSGGGGSSSGGDRNGRIVGGFPVKAPIPWQVSLQAVDETGNWRHICGAALISEFHVVSASHCINSETKYRVVLGKLNLNEESPSEQVFYIRDSDITTHRNFGYITEFGNDIAIMKLENRHGKGATFTDSVQPICIPDHDGWEFRMIPPTANCIVSGWGSTLSSYSEDLSSALRAAHVPIHNQATCSNLYNMNGELSGNQLRRMKRLVVSSKAGYGGGPRFVDGMLCAGPLSGMVDSGRGDSGGPLACEFNGGYYLVGIVSWGQNFGGSAGPGVYTRVSHYLNWISTEKELLGPN